MSSRRPVDLDDVLVRIGGFGRWQRINFVIATVSLVFFWSSNFFFVIASYSNVDTNCDLHCARNDSFSSGVEPGSCQEDHTYMKVTTVNEWNLVCNASWLRSLFQGSFFVSHAIGLLLSYQIGNLIGPQKLLCLSSVLFVVCSCITPYALFYWMIIALRLGIGLMTGLAYGSIYCIVFDTTAKRFLPLVCCSLALARFLAHYFLISFAYITQSWNLVNLIISAPVFVLAALDIWIMPESPRWYLVREKIADAKRILCKMARYNGYKSEYIWIQHIGLESNINDTRSRFLNVLSDGIMFKRFLTLSIASFFNGLSYYVLSFSPPFYRNLADWKLYTNLGLCGLLELVAVLVAMTISFFNVPRRYTALSAAVVAGLMCMLGSAVSASALSTMVLMFSSKFLISIFDVLLQVMAAEAFPTKLSASAFLVILSLNHVGAIAAPYLVISLEQDAMVPMLICGVCAVAASFAVFMAPETVRNEDGSIHKPSQHVTDGPGVELPLVVEVLLNPDKTVGVEL